MSGFAWAKEPMFPRLADLAENIPLTAIYGGVSWVAAFEKEAFEHVRSNKGHYNHVSVSLLASNTTEN